MSSVTVPGNVGMNTSCYLGHALTVLGIALLLLSNEGPTLPQRTLLQCKALLEQEGSESQV